MDKKERARELQMMQQKLPGGWPAWPFLPVKKVTRGGGWPDFGVLLDIGTIPPGNGSVVHPVVYDFNLYSREPFDETKVKEKFSSMEELLDAGWVVD